jgi:hypothetical protein
MIEAKAALLDIGFGENDWRAFSNQFLSSVTIRPLSNVNNTNNRSDVHAPKRLLASDSWRILGDIINAITAKSIQDKYKINQKLHWLLQSLPMMWHYLWIPMLSLVREQWHAFGVDKGDISILGFLRRFRSFSQADIG